MKKSILLLFSVLVLTIARVYGVPAESHIFTPYFNMSMSQGAYLPSQGSFFAGANVGMSVGLLSKISQNHSLFTLYNLGFSGEGFRFPDTQEFASKDLTHNFNGEYRWQIEPWLRLRPGVGYGIDYTRTAANEIWGEGLYDNRTLSGQLAVDTFFDFFDKKAMFTVQENYLILTFPNYTDIIRQFQNLSANQALAGNLKGQHILETVLSLNWNKIFASARYSAYSFDNERVVESNGVYGNRLQQDTRMGFTGGFQTKLWIFETEPNISYTLYRSNQNYLLFKSPTDIAPVFQGNYYDYNELGFNAPLFLNFTKKWALSGGLNYQHRDYTSRPPRDGTDTFITGSTQSNNMVTISAGIRKKLNEVSSMTLNYYSVISTSNNHFEQYLPYNYTGQGISLAYQLTY